MVTEPIALIKRRTGDWWQDDRRHWCAYCGVPIKNEAGKPAAAPTKDHVLPKAHKGRHVTIPACKPCNQKKGNTMLPDFLLTDYFSRARQKRRANQWSLVDLWLVMAMAAVEQARTHADNWPDDAVKDATPSKQQPKVVSKAAPGTAPD